MKKTKIVCTIGPATRDVEVLKEMILNGMNMARINFSHGSYEENKPYIDAVIQAREELNMPVALLLDNQGPEIRTGKVEGDKLQIQTGDKMIITNKEILGTNEKIYMNYNDLYKDVSKGISILIDDGKIELVVDEIIDEEIHCTVVAGGPLGNRKTVNVPQVELSLPALKEKDVKDLIDGCKVGFDYVSASFVRSVDDVKAIRKVLDENGGENIKIISKIESRQGVNNLESIVQISDGIMIARGDLGVEVPLEEVPVLQKDMIQLCNMYGKVVITATQMLETMTENPRPTRAEVSDVANAIYDGTGAIMLSGESAVGKFPVVCVKTMTRIAEKIESDIRYWNRFVNREFNLDNPNYEFKINHSICLTAKEMGAKAFVAYTEAGDTPRTIASFLPGCPIYAVTKCEKTYRQLAVVWGITPILIKEDLGPKELISKGIEQLKKEKILNTGDIIAIAGGNLIDEKSSAVINRSIGGVLKI